MNNLKLTPIIIAFLLLLASCKKELNNESNIAELKNNKTQINKIKEWYISQRKNISHAFSRDSIADIPTGEPEWDSTHTYSQLQSTDLVVPLRFDDENNKTNQFIILKLDANGEVVNGEYAFILLDSAATNNFTKDALETLTPETFNLISIPSNLKAWIVKYDLNYEPISAKYLSNGNVEDKDIQFRKFVFNKAPLAQCDNPVTIEWYWQIWINGELVYEEYLFSTTECSGGGGGGGGGGGNTNGFEESSDKTMIVKDDGHCLISAEYTFTGYKFPNATSNYFNYVCPKVGNEVPAFANIGTAGSPSDTWHSDWTPELNVGDVNNPNTTAFTHVNGTQHYPNRVPHYVNVDKIQTWYASSVLQ